MNGSEDLVKLLCEHGADVRLVDNESHSLIHWATGNQRSLCLKIIFPVTSSLWTFAFARHPG